MSLAKCPACGATVSKDAAACPSCGHPMKSKNTGCAVLLGLGAACIALVFLLEAYFLQAASVSNASQPDSAPSSAAVGQIVPPSDEEVAAAREANRVEADRLRNLRGPLWVYSEDRDAMSDGIVRTALLTSENSFRLGFPYEGDQRGTLMLRKHPRWGTDVVLSIQKGQLLCRHQDCTVEVRFDDGQARAWQMNEPDSHDTTLLFFSDANGIVRRIRDADRLRVQIRLYQQSPVILDFPVKGFDQARWESGPAKSSGG